LLFTWLGNNGNPHGEDGKDAEAALADHDDLSRLSCTTTDLNLHFSAVRHDDPALVSRHHNIPTCCVTHSHSTAGRRMRGGGSACLADAPRSLGV
jgi:hypothetical protein